MLRKNCPNNERKAYKVPIGGVNLIGKSTLVFSRKIQGTVFSIKDAFKEYKTPAPFSVKARRYATIASVLVMAVTLSYVTVKWLAKVNAATESHSWDFANAGDYVLSDCSLIAVSGGRAQLKVRNYTSDSSTALLYHFDENTGTTITDSSSNNNNGVITSGSWTSGQLNYGLQFNGTQTGITAPDSTSLSVQSAITLEGWTQFLSGFSANTTRLRQPIINKGSYQLFYNNETGKVQFELEPSSNDN